MWGTYDVPQTVLGRRHTQVAQGSPLQSGAMTGMCAITAGSAYHVASSALEGPARRRGQRSVRGVCGLDMESGYMVNTRLPVGVAGQLKWDKAGATPTCCGVKREDP